VKKNSHVATIFLLRRLFPFLPYSDKEQIAFNGSLTSNTNEDYPGNGSIGDGLVWFITKKRQ
jgi:hypothetical protein